MPRRRASPCLSTVDAAEHHSLPNITAPGMQQRRDKQGRGCKRRTDHFIRARLQSGRFFREGHFPEVRREVQQKVGVSGAVPEGRLPTRRDGAVSTAGHGEFEPEASHGRGRATEP